MKLVGRPFTTLLLLILFININEGQNGAQLFDNTYLHEIYLEFYDTDYWDILTDNYGDFATFSGSDIPYLPAKVTIDGEILDSVGIRFKGKSAYYYVDEKKPFKLDFNEFVSGQKYDGLKKINLHNGLGDPGMLRNLLAYDLMRIAGVPAPRVSFCKLFINGEYWGVYDLIEQIDKTFLNSNFADDSGNLFKNQRWTELKWFGSDPDLYRDTFELKTNTEEDDWSDFIHFLDVLNNSTDEYFPTAIQEVFNVDAFLHVLAIDIMTNNWDSYIDNARNFYLYHEPESGLFHWIPWDYNLSLGGRISLSGNPYPPFDPFCMIRTEFEYYQDSMTVQFNESTEPSADGYLWDFGDGQTSTEEAPAHTYAEAGVYEVCLSVYRLEDNELCEQKRCNRVDLTFDPGSCTTIQNGDSPYPASDPIFQKVIAEDDFCCNNDWDAACQFLYLEILEEQGPIEISSGNSYDADYDLLLNNPNKILIHRLLSVPEFRQRYLDITCIIRENFFNESYFNSKVDYFGDLIRSSIHDDPNYLYTHDYFEYDVGNGTGGGEEARIPALRYFFFQRFQQVQDDIDTYQEDCSGAFTTYEWHDIVINEFVASADEGFSDANGEFDDWIELFNNTNDTIYLDHYYLSDDINKPKKWSFSQEDFIIPGGYLIVWSDKDLSQQGIHASFKLSQLGEEILLSHGDGTWIDYIAFETQLSNLASARVPNGTGAFTIQDITPGENNDIVNSSVEIFSKEAVLIMPNPTVGHFSINLDLSQNLPTVWSYRILNSLGQQLYTSPTISTQSVNLDLKDFNLHGGIYFVEMNLDGVKHLEKILFIN